MMDKKEYDLLIADIKRAVELHPDKFELDIYNNEGLGGSISYFTFKSKLDGFKGNFVTCYEFDKFNKFNVGIVKSYIYSQIRPYLRNDKLKDIIGG